LSLRFDLIDKPLLSSSKFSDSHKLIHLLAVPVSILLHIILYDETTQMFLDSESFCLLVCLLAVTVQRLESGIEYGAYAVGSNPSSNNTTMLLFFRHTQG